MISKFIFQRLVLGAINEIAAREHALDRGIDFVAQLPVLGAQSPTAARSLGAVEYPLSDLLRQVKRCMAIFRRDPGYTLRCARGVQKGGELQAQRVVLHILVSVRPEGRAKDCRYCPGCAMSCQMSCESWLGG